jgi:hypothetical protein
LPLFTKDNFDTIAELKGSLDPSAPLLSSTERHFVLAPITQRSLTPTTDTTTLKDWQEAMFNDFRTGPMSHGATIARKDVLDAFCGLPSSNVSEPEPSTPKAEGGPKETVTDKFTYRDMAGHFQPPSTYIKELEDYYRVPPLMQENFTV